MHPRVERFPAPAPDYQRFLAAIARSNAGRIPAVELAVHPEVVAALLGEAVAFGEPGSTGPVPATVRLLHRLGYDVVKVSAGIPFQFSTLAGEDASELSRGARTWQDSRSRRIATQADCDAYPWPQRADLDFSPVEAASSVLPPGMGILGFCGGVLEYASYLMGLEGLMLALYDAPHLVHRVIDHVGQVLYDAFERYCTVEQVVALWLGDDLGSKNGLLVSPAFLRERVLPWYRRYVELAHRHGRPFLLHSCGRIQAIVPELVDVVGIDAKHSFEDAIEPVETFMDRWSGRIAVMGGVDVHLLALGDEAAVRSRVRQLLAHAAPTRGYVCGSGNSIPNYVPPGNYLAMLEELAAFNAAFSA